MRAVMAASYSFVDDYFVYNYIFHPLYLVRIIGFHDFCYGRLFQASSWENRMLRAGSA